MNNAIKITKITPTVFLVEKLGVLHQLVKLTIHNDEKESTCYLIVKTADNISEIPLGILPEGESIHEVFIKEISENIHVEFVLKCKGVVTDEKVTPWNPVKHWVVHVIQGSHHDVGYSDIPSAVIAEHDELLADAILCAEKTQNYPEDAKFRIVIEQAWSLNHFMNNTSSENAEKMAELLRSGQFEATALFGNMTTEICGHEVMSRLLYHASGLKKKYGYAITSAEHNDITGISWGLSRVLTDSDIKIFCPGIPLYYSWSSLNLQSFWDEKAIFPHGGPGAFWWEAPTGKRILFWCNNSGCGGDFHQAMPLLSNKLMELNRPDYPYSVTRWPVMGGHKDNSPYIVGYSDTIKEWNEKWAFPRLISSTNTRFYNDFVKTLPIDLPVFKGELAGQDYPAGATSTAEATAANRNNHHGAIFAEKFSAAAAAMTDYKYRKDILNKIYEDILFHDEHAWGYYFNGGPAMKISEYEKAINAYRASSHIHELTRKSIASIADNISKKDEDFHLVVFNSSDHIRTGPVNTPMLEIFNGGSQMTMLKPEEDEVGLGFLEQTILNDRNPERLQSELMEGKFDLVDTVTGKNVPFQIILIDSHSNPVPFSDHRFGLGSEERRLGLSKELCFVAEEIPAFGYKAYKMIARETSTVFPELSESTSNSIENEYYKICIDTKNGCVTSIYDKKSSKELLDKDCSHSFGTIVVRNPLNSEECYAYALKAKIKLRSSVCSIIEITGSIYGHPSFTQEIKLYAGIKQIHFGMRILKDATPLLDAHVAFPFAMEKPEFRYEGAFCVMNPIQDYLPGSYSDTIGVQNWVKVTNKAHSIVWSSLDAPVAGFSGLWPGHVSPAHRYVINQNAAHPPLREEDLTKGWIYSNIFNNNFGTNFSVSQVGDILFRYVISTFEGELTDSLAAKSGWDAVCGLVTVFIKKPSKGTLPLSGSFMQIDNENIVSVTFKKAEDGRGYIVRLWNLSENTEYVTVKLNYLDIGQANLTNLAEEDLETAVEHDSGSFCLEIEKQGVVTVRLMTI